MKKNIWILNHYATIMYKKRAGRHYWFAENLMKNGYKPTIFCANSIHNTTENLEVGDKSFSRDEVNGVPFVFVKTSQYSDNGKERIKNMYSFYKNLRNVSKKYALKYGKPDVIIASSVHPLTLLAGIKIAKKFGVPCICEVRDLWPESLVAYNIIKKNSFITHLLYRGEKWLYKNAHSIIMTWEGGKKYIINQQWDDQIDLKKIKYISNGLDLESFDINSNQYKINDPDLEDKRYKNVVYTGSIRKVNNIGQLIQVAKILKSKGANNIRFIIYGSGNESEDLIRYCKKFNLKNVIFKGKVDKKYIPSILKESYINILHNSSSSLNIYGQSQNKLFEYLAAGKCIIQTYSTDYNILHKYNCGMTVNNQSDEEIAELILQACADEKKVEEMGYNARLAAPNYDFKNLTKKLINVIENT